ncbi:MAG: hypothetical protein JSS91_02165 [Bacteroidetes bacterium]|nr:hypothetical protein [Bacteroidota bacterium]
MRQSDEIFQLIAAMSDREIRFFRKKYTLFISDDEGNYIKLFDDISKQISSGNVYNEKIIKSGNYTGKFLKNLSFHKNYLYSILLKTLSIYHIDSKDIFSVRNLLTQSEILSDKLLYDQSLKLLKRAKKIAFEKDLLNSRNEILSNERNIFKYTYSAEDYSLMFEDIFKEQFENIDIQKNLLDYYLLNEKVGIFLRTFGSGKVRGSEHLKNFEKLFEDPLLLNIENAKSFFSRYIFYNLNLQLHLTNNNFEEAYNNAKEAVKLWENNPEKIAGKPDNYIFSLNNLLNTQNRTNRYDEFKSTELKMRNMPDRFPGTLTEANKVFIFYSLSILNLSIFLKTVNTENLRSAENEIRKDLDKYENKITLYQRIILYYFLSCSNFVQEDFEKCIYWNGKIFNLGKTDLSEDYQCYARIIQLISYFELGYIDSMEYALKSAYHFISKKKKNYKYENTIQKYLKRTFHIKSNNELSEMFIEMKHDLEKLLKDPFEKNAFDAFNIIYWLESKINKTSITETLRSGKT